MYEVVRSKWAKEYLDSMPKKHQEKAEAFITHLEAQGPALRRPYADHVRGKIMELRVGTGTFEYRFLYFFDGKKIILTHGFLKKEDAIREGEIRFAETFYRNYFGA